MIKTDLKMQYIHLLDTQLLPFSTLGSSLHCHSCVSKLHALDTQVLIFPASNAFLSGYRSAYYIRFF